MMKIKQSIFQIALFCFGAAALTAQPTLQNNVFPSIGQAISTAEATDSNAVSEGAAGANITWNFSGLLAASSTNTTNFLTPAGTPYEPLFPAANLCGVVYDVENVYSYYQKSSTELKVLGLASQDLSIEYTNPQTVLKVPLSYGNSFTDTYWGNFNAGGILVSTNGEIDSEYDAYGTLILPLGTYTNVIRIKTESIVLDTIDFGGLFNFSEISTTSYEWYDADTPGPLVVISYSEGTSSSYIPGFPIDVENIPLSKSISFTTGIAVGVTDVPKLENISLAFRGANPVSDVLALDITSTTTGETLQLQVFGRNGQLVSSQNITTNGATLSVDVNVTDCRSGLYFVGLTDGKARLSKGFVKM